MVSFISKRYLSGASSLHLDTLNYLVDFFALKTEQIEVNNSILKKFKYFISFYAINKLIWLDLPYSKGIYI